MLLELELGIRANMNIVAAERGQLDTCDVAFKECGSVAPLDGAA